jgi:hypothetical protein
VVIDAEGHGGAAGVLKLPTSDGLGCTSVTSTTHAVRLLYVVADATMPGALYVVLCRAQLVTSS